MATGGKLEVQIGADKSDFDKKIKEVEFDIQQLSKVKLEKIRLGLDTTEINSQIKDAKNNLNQLKSAVKDSGQSFNNFKPAVANGGNALMQFSRIAQDAPFGIIGIGNNITATVEAFSALQNSAGSTGGALKAIGSSILGSGGVLLGVSLLTTGLTYLAQSGLSVGDVIDKITGNFDEFGAAIKKANEEAVKNSAAEISGLNALVSTAKNVTVSMHDRLIAVNELQKQYPGYFGNLTKEQILNGNVESAVKSVTQALIAKAKAQAFTAEIVKLAEEEFKLEEKRAELTKEQARLQKGLAEAIKFATSGAGQGARGLSIALEQVNKDLSSNKSELEKNASAQAKWTEKINENVAASIRLKDELGKPVKTFNTPQVSPVSTLTPAGIKPFNVQPVKASIVGLADEVDRQNTRMLVALADFNNQANQIIQNSIANTFIGLGEAIGSAIANGSDVLQAVGSSLLSSLGSILIDLGKMAIQIGVGLIAIKFALNSLNPAAAIGAGIALVALGSLFKAQTRSIGGRISGGGGVSGSSGSGANNGSFTNSGFASANGGGTVVFEIAGTKLIGVLSNTINSNKRLGGQLGLG